MSRFDVPIAIVVAGALVAIAVYSGLRSSPTPVALTPPASPVSSPVEVEREARAALEPHRDALRQSCGQRSMSLELDFTFGADGQQIIRGVMDLSDGGDNELLSCVLDHLPSLQVPPPGGNVRVRVGTVLP